MRDTKQYQPKTGTACGCKRGVERDNCPRCEGTGQVVDFAAIRAKALTPKQSGAGDCAGHTPGPWHVDTSNGEFQIVNDHGQTVFLIGDDRRLIPMLEDRMLITQAPSLLAERDALRDALKASVHQMLFLRGVISGKQDEPLDGSSTCVIVLEARAALAQGGDK